MEQGAAARRSPVRAGRPPFFLDGVSLSGSDRSEVRRHEPAPPSRRYGGSSNGCSTQATAYLRDTPPTRRESCAALMDESGFARICPTFPVDPSTDQCDRKPWGGTGLMQETTPAVVVGPLVRTCEHARFRCGVPLQHVGMGSLVAHGMAVLSPAPSCDSARISLGLLTGGARMAKWLRRNADKQAMASPNLFVFATKELSQDAVICWLIAWAGAETKGNPEGEELRRCGRTLVDALFSKWQDRGGVELDDQIRTEVLQQERNIDVLARVDCRHVLLIEDKTDTGAHDDQLAKYWTLVVEGKTAFGRVEEKNLHPIYCKTGNHSLRDRQHVEEQKYRVFDRNDFLSVLETYQGGNGILLDFRRHLVGWQRDTDSFPQWTIDGERTSRGWEGFYRWIEENCLAGYSDDWGPLGSLVGGYWGIWIEPVETSRNSRFAIWIEKDRISLRLFGAKRRESVLGMNREKEHWARAFVERGGGRFTRPRRLEATSSKPMCVAEWRGWLAFGDSGRVDLARTAKNLKRAKKILLDTIKDGRR